MSSAGRCMALRLLLWSTQKTKSNWTFFRHYSSSKLGYTHPDLLRGVSRQSRRSLALEQCAAIAEFSTTFPFSKKKSKGGGGGVSGSHEDDNKQASKSAAPPSEDPFDLSVLTDEISTIQTKLRTSLSQLRSGGQFNSALLEQVRVQPSKTDRTTYPLSDLAQVVPRGGREVHILVGEAEHVKAVTSAVQGSRTLNLTPTPDPTGQNGLLLVVRVPPPTAESRRAVVGEAGKVGDTAHAALRDARARQHKKFRKLELDRSVRPDDRRKEHARMEDVVKKAGEEIKKIVDAAKKALDK